MLKFLILVIVTVSRLAKCGQHNVCKDLADYATIDKNDNCWYNPDVGSLPQDIITRRGYPFESYSITTDDGYFNVLYRIPHNNTDKDKIRQPILLHAGLGGGPLSFVQLGNRSLGFFLVNNGFDVWLAHRRGSIDEPAHTEYSKKDKEFWDFSFHESGYYDIKSEINFIAGKTKRRKKIILLGYSLGTTETYIYAILRRKHAKQNLASIISLSPIAFMRRSGGALRSLAPHKDMIESFLESVNIYALHLQEKLTSDSDDGGFNFEQLLSTQTLLMNIAGYVSSQTDPADLPVYTKQQTSPVSVKTLLHFGQEMNAGGEFQHYDYGPMENLKRYNSSYPPPYDVSRIKVPVHLFYAKSDIMSNQEDVQELYSKLKVRNKSLTDVSQDDRIKFNHLDFILAKDITELLHEVLLKTINENLRG